MQYLGEAAHHLEKPNSTPERESAIAEKGAPQLTHHVPSELSENLGESLVQRKRVHIGVKVIWV